MNLYKVKERFHKMRMNAVQERMAQRMTKLYETKESLEPLVMTMSEQQS